MKKKKIEENLSKASGKKNWKGVESGAGARGVGSLPATQ